MVKGWSFLLLILLFIGCKSEVQNDSEIILRPVKYASVTKSALASLQHFSGVAQSSKEAAVSFRVNGTLTDIYVKIGDRVRKGQRLARIDATDYTVQHDQMVAQLKSAETQTKSARASLVNALATYDRAEKLYENNSVPLSEYQQAKAAKEAAESQYEASVAQVEASQAQLKAATNQVGYAVLLAPFSGIINALHLEENEMVAAGNPVAILSTDQDPEVLVGVPELFIGQIRKNMSVQIRFAQVSDQVYRGTITEVGFGAGTGSTYPVTVKIIEPDQSLRPGMTAQVTFDFSQDGPATRNSMVVPVSAIAKSTSGHFVFKLEEDQENFRAVKSPIQIGDLLADGFEVKEGLNEGDLIATAGLKSLLDGMQVTLLSE